MCLLTPTFPNSKDLRQGVADGRHFGNRLGALNAQLALGHANAHHLLALHRSEQLKRGSLIDIVGAQIDL